MKGAKGQWPNFWPNKQTKKKCGESPGLQAEAEHGKLANKTVASLNFM